MHRARPCLLVALALSLAPVGPALAQQATLPKPVRKGHKLSVKVDSVPPGASIYVDDKAYGLEGYTPTTLKLPKGTYKIIIELQGFKSVERVLPIDRSQGFTFPLEKQARPAVLDVRASGDGSAAGATLVVDGTAVGTVPNRVEVAAGSHLIEVRRQGYTDFRDTVQVGEGENRTMAVVLAQAVRPGSILVTADVANAEVYLDGTRKDFAPTVIENLPEGGHTVEVRKEGMNPWRQVVTVTAGQQTKVAATLTPPAPTVGSLRVLCPAPAAEVFVDGEPKGPANMEIKDVRPGTHIVEVRATGFEPKRTEVEVRPNDLRVVQMDLAPAVVARQSGGLRVISAVPDAEVFIDGASVGKVPVDRNDLATGKHYVLVHKDGYADFKMEVDVDAGKTMQVVANLKAAGSLRVVTNIAGAEVLIDGTPVGKTPATLDDVATGQHVVEFRSNGYIPARQTITVAGGQQQVVSVDLVPISTGPTVGELMASQREQSSFGATIVPRYKFNVDIGTGHPYFLSARVISGIFRQGGFGADVGVELRSNFYETDVGIRPRVQFFRADPVAVGMDFALLGGGGPDKRDGFHFELGAMITMIAGQYVRLTFRPYLVSTTDRLCPSVEQIKDDDLKTGVRTGTPQMIEPGSGNLYKGEKDICKAYDKTRAGDYKLPGTSTTTFQPFGQNDPRERFSTTRFMLQGIVELLLTPNFNLWLIVEGAPKQDERQAFTSKFNAAFTDNDFPFYARFGATFKF